MTDKQPFDISSLEKLIGYFELQVLASYRNEPDKHTVETDFFEGHVSTTDEYFRELEAAGRISEYIDIRFGYRTLENGDLAIVAWLPDLFEKSKSHAQRWSGFHIREPKWFKGPDDRFKLWLRRYILGDWEVDNGPRYYLGETIRTINGLTNEAVGSSLFKFNLDESLTFPEADNTYRYQDAHSELYGYLIDGLNKDCIKKIVGYCKREINVENMRPVKALKNVLPDITKSSNFCVAFDLVSEQRRLASHGVRESAKRFPAFERFTRDLELCIDGLKDLLVILEKEFDMNAVKALKRYEAKKHIPTIVREAEPLYSVCQAKQIVGKTVKQVEFGFRKDIQHVHGSEVIIIHFTDGSIISIDTGSNVGNIEGEIPNFKAEDVHVRFDLHWVPELSKGKK